MCSEERSSTRKGNVGAKSCAQGDKNSKKILVPNEIKAVMTSGQDPAQLSFQFVRRD